MMHPDGYVISDIWKDLPLVDNYTQLSTPILDAILRMVDFGSDHVVRGIIGPREGVEEKGAIAEPAIQYKLPGFLEPVVTYSLASNTIGDEMVNVVHHGDALKILKRYPDNSASRSDPTPKKNCSWSYALWPPGWDACPPRKTWST